MEKSAYLIQIEQKIESLISGKKYKEAHDLCLYILEKDPDNRVFIKLKTKVEEFADEENTKIIKERLKEVKKLKKEERYSEALTLLKTLEKISPNNKSLEEEHKETQESYIEKIKKQQKEFNKKQTERLEEILKNSPEKLLEELVRIEKQNPGNKTVQDLGKTFREELIKKKIKEKKELLNSTKFEIIGNFLTELRKIEKNSPAIMKLSKEIDGRKRENLEEEEKEFIYGGTKHLDTLMKLKKFDKAIQVAKEILSVNKKNKIAQQTLKKAEKKLFKQSKNLSIENIYQNLEKLKEEYKSDKNNFVKI